MEALIRKLQDIVGPPHVLTSASAKRRYCRGYRYGQGDAAAVVRPGSLRQMWQVLQACHAADTIVICQAANTGLTGGSSPAEAGYDRPVIVLNTLRLRRLELLAQGQQVLTQPGVTLDQLERTLKPLGREPHSVIGSSCMGASVTGGICNNSGGSLIRRGPAYTQLSLYAQVDSDGQLRLVNHLGLELGETPEEILDRLDSGQLPNTDSGGVGAAADCDCGGRHASDHEYAQHVRDVDAATPARYNADPRRLYEASGSAGHVVVFALRLDTFTADASSTVFYIGSNDAAELEDIRRGLLQQSPHLPIAGEYMHRSAFEASERYGKDLFLFIHHFGTERLMQAFAMKSRVDAWLERLGLRPGCSDRLLQRLSEWLPRHLPARLTQYRDLYQHHLLLKMSEDGAAFARGFLQARMPSVTGDFFECDAAEGRAAFLNRFVVGAAIVRYRAVHAQEVEDIVALDIALPRNTRDWFEQLPPAIAEKIRFTMYCGHFFCHVMHQEYLVRKGEDCEQVKSAILALLDAKGAKYPAEHNVGHQYRAEPALEDFYRRLDPTNSFNPGVGKTSRLKHWR
ncbi:D-lactate dehydrogenase [Herbaspirillum sp. C7C2]|uniref:D-lactate dehydrogenase n=1 Tax=Herbaspirillum sp. C7C2 TaxID=2736666 RepID=UPI001F5252E7|nr:D-lactate dehydrogenase [Herbaspirillum sp. C7C2]MCI1014139.1 D-lactate dehydrogenase [Herbaspirillum sp. C7C2]